MIRTKASLFAALVLAPTIASVPLSSASAQEAIMLETFGFVRMAPPQEIERRTAATAEAPQRRLPAEAARPVAAARQAAVTTY